MPSILEILNGLTPQPATVGQPDAAGILDWINRIQAQQRPPIQAQVQPLAPQGAPIPVAPSAPVQEPSILEGLGKLLNAVNQGQTLAGPEFQAFPPNPETHSPITNFLRAAGSDMLLAPWNALSGINRNLANPAANWLQRNLVQTEAETQAQDVAAAAPPTPLMPQQSYGFAGQAPAAAAPSQPATPASNPQRVYQFFLGKGLSPQAAAAMTGQAMAESFPHIDPRAGGDSGTAFGTFQWNNDRLEGLAKFAEDNGLLPDELETQLEYAWQELNSTEKSALEGLTSARNLEEATDAAIGFERPEGWSRGNPRAGHNWSGRQTYAQQVFNAFSGLPPMAPEVRAFEGQPPPNANPFLQGLPPTLGTPPARPMSAPPDYSSMNAWLERGAPAPVDEAAMRRQAMRMALVGLAQGGASVDASDPTQLGRLFASAGAGLGGGYTQGMGNLLEAQRALAGDQSQYAMTRAQVAGNQANTLADVSNRNLQLGWENASDIYDTGNLNAQNRYQVGQENARATAAAGDTNAMRQYDFATQQAQARAQADAANTQNAWQRESDIWSATRPKIVHTSDDGIIVQETDPQTGRSNFRSIPIGPAISEAQQVATTLKSLGATDEAAEIAMFDALQQTGNMPAYQRAIIETVLAKGQGEQVFGEAYKAHKEFAEEELSAQRDQSNYEEALNKAIAAGLFADTARSGNQGWIASAASLGNYGARQLVPQAPFTNQRF